MPTWDPQQYERFGDHRTRPFFDLIAQVGSRDPRLVIDLGCGNGPMTLAAAERWSSATVIGVDSSPDMLERARSLDVDGRVSWIEADAGDWQVDSSGQPDVILSNATLQWVPRHRELIPRWLEALSDGGWFAMQVPGKLRRALTPDHSRGRGGSA